MFKNRSQWNDAQIDEWLSAYLDDILTAGERARLETRLEREPALRERLEGLRMTVAALAALPAVDAPRNFILLPAMVAQTRPAARPRRRQTWPVFGWATAVATLLLAVVLAGDLFWVRPARRAQPSDIVALAPEPALRESMATETETLVQAAPEAAPTGMVEEKQAAVEETPAPAAAERAAVTAEATLAPPPMAEAPPAAPLDTAQASLAFSAALTSGMVMTAEMPLAAAPTITLAVTEAAVEEAVAGMPSPSPEPLVVEQAPEPTLTPTEQGATATPAAVAAQPAGENAARAGEQEEASEALPWLQLVEALLAALVIGLAAATGVLRWREAKH